jgi:hypothetical protein
VPKAKAIVNGIAIRSLIPAYAVGKNSGKVLQKTKGKL